MESPTIPTVRAQNVIVPNLYKNWILHKLTAILTAQFFSGVKGSLLSESSTAYIWSKSTQFLAELKRNLRFKFSFYLFVSVCLCLFPVSLHKVLPSLHLPLFFPLYPRAQTALQSINTILHTKLPRTAKTKCVQEGNDIFRHQLQAKLKETRLSKMKYNTHRMNKLANDQISWEIHQSIEIHLLM